MREREREEWLTHSCFNIHYNIALTTYSNSLGNSSRLEHATHCYVDYYVPSIAIDKVDPVIMLCIINEAIYTLYRIQ